MATVARRGILTIAVAVGTASMSVTLWFPFMPLFLLQIGAGNDAEAAFWLAMGLTAQGIGRLLGGPIWGVISDRVGRRAMFLRALFFTGVVTVGTCAITAPWQLIVTLALFGVFSGFSPAAIALASVSVPDARLKATLAMVSGGQYIGQAIGPAIGAALALLVGYRGSMAVSGLAVIAVGIAVLRWVPSDMPGGRRGKASAAGAPGHDAQRAPALEPFRMTIQLAMAILVYGILFGLSGFRMVSTSIALKEIDAGNVIAHTGIAFALVGVASVLGVLLVSSNAIRRQRLRTVLVVATLLSAASYLLLALGSTVTSFIVALTIGSLLNAAMLPATNTLIAMNAARSRRGTAFGFASASQAVGTMGGPLAAAAFAATSLELGFAAIAAVLVGLALWIALVVREPEAEKTPLP